MASYYVTLRLRGGSADQPVGWLGPYARRSSALVDAGSLASPSIHVEVSRRIPATSGAPGSAWSVHGTRSNPFAAIAAAGARVLSIPGVKTFLAAEVLPWVMRSVHGGLDAFQSATRAEQVAALRKIAGYLPPPNRMLLQRLLKNDKAAASIARAFSSKKSVEAMKAAASSAGYAAEASFA